TYGIPLNLINAMGVFNPGNPSSYLNNIQISNADLVDATYDAKLDWKIPFKLSDNISGKISLGGKYHSVNRTSIGNQEQEYMQYGDGSGTRLAIQNSYVNLFPGLAGLTGVGASQSGIPASPFVDPSYSRTDILGYPIGPNWFEHNLVIMANEAKTNPGVAIWQQGVQDFNQNYTDNEKSQAGYLMGEFNIGNSLTIVPGARYQEEKTDISAYHIQPVTANANGLAALPVLWDTKRDNPYWYPSVNIKYKATENIQIMGAVYRSVSLPSYSDIYPLL